MRRAFLLALFVVGIFYSYFLLRHLDGLNRDNLEQTGAALSYVESGDFTSPKAFRSDLAESRLVRIEGWPTAYSRMYGTLLKMGLSIERVRSGLDLLSVVVFFISWLMVFQLLVPLISQKALLGLLLFWLFGFSPLLSRLSTDGLSLALLSGSVAVSMRAVSNKSYAFFWAVVSGGLATCTICFRYAYYPIPLFIGLAFFFFCLRQRPREWRLWWGYCSGCVFTFLLLSPWSIGNDLSLLVSSSDNSIKSGTLHWEQLHGFYPFLAEFLGLHRLFPTLLAKLGFGETAKITVYWIIFVFVLFFAVVGMLNFRKARERVSFFFFLVGLVICIGVPLSLLAVALFEKLYAYPGFSVLGTPRYFSPTVPFTLVFAVQGWMSLSERRLVRIPAIIAVLFVLTNALGWHVWRGIKVASCGYLAPTFSYYRKYQELDRLTDFLSAQRADGRKVFFIDEDPIRGNYLTLSEAFCLPTPEFASSLPFSVFVIRNPDKVQTSESCRLISDFGDNPRALADLGGFSRLVNAKVVLQSVHWIVYEGTIPVGVPVQLPSELGCLINPGQWNYYSVAGN